MVPSVIEDVVRRHPTVDEFRIEVTRRHEMRDRTVAAVGEDVRHTVGLRVETAAVAAGTLPRFELKARRVVHAEGTP